ncbi:MAG TPA: TerB N-terminal domain-containing protein [Nitrolancea sp.]
MSSKHIQGSIHPDLVSAAELKNDPKRRSNWVAPGETVTIHGLEISSGMFYMGSALVNEEGRRVTNEPSIINPAKPVDPTESQQSPYWYGSQTSYQSMSASDRWLYLKWLASGRTLPTTPNLVTLFLSGLERRALVDARHDPAAQAEIPAIEAEVRRLLRQHNAFMFGYQAKQFLLALRLVSGDLDREDLRPPALDDGWEVPLEMKIALGGFALRGEPLSPRWALAWTRSDPNIRLSTPAERCRKEFNDLFLKRYAEEHGDGMKLRDNKTRIRFHYSPSNRSLWGAVTLEAPNLPDVTRQRKATMALSLVAQVVARELDPYSRWVATHDDRASLRAVALLPVEICGRRKAVQEFRKWAEKKLCGKTCVELPVSEFVDLWSRSSTGNLTRREAEQLSEFLERFQYGIEPDICFGGVDPARLDALAFFRLPAAAKREPQQRLQDYWQAPQPGQRISDAFMPALTLLRLGLVVVLEKGKPSPAQLQLLESFIARAPGLAANERTRLRARLSWSLSQPVDIKGLKQRCAELPNDEDRQRCARFLVVLAGIDNRIGPDELKALEKAYRLLGLKREEIARDVHAVAVAMSEPVTIIPADVDAPGFALPAERPEPSKDRVRLSTDRVAAIVAETRLVGEVLGDVFMGDEAEIPEPVTAAEPETPAVALDLDNTHTELARRLSERARWSRAEVEQLSAELGLMAAGAIEALNEAAFALADEPFLEGDDLLDVNTEFVAEFMHA